MKLRLGTACDFATEEGNDKLTLVGMFSRLEQEHIPSTVGRFFVALVFVADRDDYGKPWHLRTDMLDPDGQPTSLTMQSDMPPFLEPADQDGLTEADLIIEVTDMVFEKYGMYRLNVIANDSKIGEVPIGIRRRARGLEQSTKK